MEIIEGKDSGNKKINYFCNKLIDLYYLYIHVFTCI